MRNGVTLVVPCFNEAERWVGGYWLSLLDAGISLIFVDDGSLDETARLIREYDSQPRVSSLFLPKNHGKGEAVRAGLKEALQSGAEIVGFLDADGAFPADEVVRLAHMADHSLTGAPDSYESIWSARVQLAGRKISRRPFRHYLGRVVATLVFPWHRYDIYDTQSGYKLIRSGEVLQRVLEEPFETRWFFDIELLQRWRNLAGKPMQIWEEPVLGWCDVDGSKINSTQYRQLARDLWSVRRRRKTRTPK